MLVLVLLRGPLLCRLGRGCDHVVLHRVHNLGLVLYVEPQNVCNVGFLVCTLKAAADHKLNEVSKVRRKTLARA